ncbi:MAG TPA: DUF6545 domain-containing protein [Pseudonocardiaceae bacterium]|nr:DUF6545 domain-containing protein [Pseudonocardiaceae bacterium]
MLSVVEPLSVVLLIAALLGRAPTALVRPTYRWLWSACAALTVSIFIYVSAVFDWSPLNVCGMPVNVWGLGTSIAIAVFAALAARASRGTVVAVAVGYIVASAFVVYRGLVEIPSPVGCLDRVDVPWYDPFWWVLILVHIGSTSYATVVCGTFARMAENKESMHVELRLLAAGMVSSTLFWTGILVILLTGYSPLIGPLQYLISTTSLLLAAGLLVDPVRGLAERMVAARRYRELEPLHRYLAIVVGERPLSSPGSLGLLLSSAYPPQDRLYRLTVTIRDGLLEVIDFHAGRRGGPPDARIELIHRIIVDQGWKPGAEIDTPLALRVAAKLAEGDSVSQADPATLV